LEWFDRLPTKAQVKCLARLEALQEYGNELRRPIADYLRDGIYELRTSVQHVNYRMLYTFVGQNVALLSHGLVKESKVPPAEIDLAVERKKRFEVDPEKHSFRGE
jgi:phage-related protein